MLGAEWVLSEARGSNLACFLTSTWPEAWTEPQMPRFGKGRMEDVERDKQAPLSGTSCWIAPKTERLGGEKAHGGVGPAVAGWGGEAAAAQGEALGGSAPAINEGEGSKWRLWSCPWTRCVSQGEQLFPWFALQVSRACFVCCYSCRVTGISVTQNLRARAMRPYSLCELLQACNSSFVPNKHVFWHIPYNIRPQPKKPTF